MGIIIQNLRQQKVKNIDEALHLLQFGEEYRVKSDYDQKYRVTDYNSHSSRSHTIFKVYVETTETNSKGRKKVVLSCLVEPLSNIRIWWIWQDLSD